MAATSHFPPVASAMSLESDSSDSEVSSIASDEDIDYDSDDSSEDENEKLVMNVLEQSKYKALRQAKFDLRLQDAFDVAQDTIDEEGDDPFANEVQENALSLCREELHILQKLQLLQFTIADSPNNRDLHPVFLEEVADVVLEAIRYYRSRGGVTKRDVRKILLALRGGGGVMNPVISYFPKGKNRQRAQKQEERHIWERSQTQLIRDIGQTAVIVAFAKNKRFSQRERILLATLWPMNPKITYLAVQKEIAKERGTPLEAGFVSKRALQDEKRRFKECKEQPLKMHEDFVKKKRKAGAKSKIGKDPDLALDILDGLMNHESADMISDNLKDREDNPIRIYSQCIQDFFVNMHNKGSILI